MPDNEFTIGSIKPGVTRFGKQDSDGLKVKITFTSKREPSDKDVNELVGELKTLAEAYGMTFTQLRIKEE